MRSVTEHTPVGTLVVAKTPDGRVLRAKTSACPVSGPGARLTVTLEGVDGQIAAADTFVLPGDEERIPLEDVLEFQDREAQMRGMSKPPIVLNLEEALRTEFQTARRTLTEWQEIIYTRAARLDQSGRMPTN